MPWVKVGDEVADAPQVFQVGNEALGAYMRLAAYSARHMLDGFIPAPAALTMADAPVIAKLVSAAMLVPAEAEAGYRLSWDAVVHIRTKEQIQAEKEATAKRVAEWKQRKEQEERKSNGVSNGHGNGVTNGSGNGVKTDLKHRPDPDPDPDPDPVPVPKDLRGEEARTSTQPAPLLAVVPKSEETPKKRNSRAAAKRGSGSKKGLGDLALYRQDAVALWEYQEQLRRAVNPRMARLEPTDERLRLPCERLAEGYTSAELRRALRYQAEEERRRDPALRPQTYFNGKSNWSRGSLDFALGQPDVGEAVAAPPAKTPQQALEEQNAKIAARERALRGVS